MNFQLNIFIFEARTSQNKPSNFTSVIALKQNADKSARLGNFDLCKFRQKVGSMGAEWYRKMPHCSSILWIVTQFAEVGIYCSHTFWWSNGKCLGHPIGPSFKTTHKPDSKFSNIYFIIILGESSIRQQIIFQGIQKSFLLLQYYEVYFFYSVKAHLMKNYQTYIWYK